MRRTLLLFGLPLMSALAVVGYKAWPAPQAQRANPSDNDELIRMRHDLEQMRQESARLTQFVGNVAQVAEARAQQDVKGSVVAATDAHVANEPSKPAPLSHEEYVTHAEAEFVGEAADPRWNPARDLTTKVTAVLPAGSSLRSLECRSSMCRMETTHVSSDDYVAFTRTFALTAGPPIWSGPVVFQMTPARAGGEVTAVAFLGRESLPVAQQ
jgi:hypothetical protein